jgi:hypothetical protein
MPSAAQPGGGQNLDHTRARADDVEEARFVDQRLLHMHRRDDGVVARGQAGGVDTGSRAGAEDADGMEHRAVLGSLDRRGPWPGPRDRSARDAIARGSQRSTTLSSGMTPSDPFSHSQSVPAPRPRATTAGSRQAEYPGQDLPIR